MKRNRTSLMIVVASILLFSILSCGGSPTPDAPPPTVTVAELPAPAEPTEPPRESGYDGVLAQLEYAFGGVDFEYPADWVMEGDAETLVLAESQQVLDSFDWGMGATFVLFSGAPEQVADEMWVDDLSAESLLDALVENFSDEEGFEQGDMETRSFADGDGVGQMAKWVLDGASIQAYMAVYLDEAIAALSLAISPEAAWDDNWVIFDTILSSMVFYAPTESVDRGDIGLGEVRTATLDLGGVDDWTYSSPGDEYVTVVVESSGDWDPTLEVWQDQDLIAYDDDSGDSFDPKLSYQLLPVPGDYVFKVSTYGGHGEYQITLTDSPPPGGGSLSYGDRVEGVIDEGEAEIWTFEGSAGDLVTISMVGEMELTDTYLELRDPEGVTVAEDDDSGEDSFALIQEALLSKDGVYQITARAYSDDVGPYSLTLENSQVQAQPIADGQTVSGELTEDQVKEFWSFEASEGDIVTIGMVGLGELTDTYLELYGPDGTLVTRDDDSGEDNMALIEAYELAQEGTYLIMARGYGASLGEYELSLTISQ